MPEEKPRWRCPYCNEESDYVENVRTVYDRFSISVNGLVDDECYDSDFGDDEDLNCPKCGRDISDNIRRY